MLVSSFITFRILHRHSLHSISVPTVLATMEGDIWVMHWRSIKWDRIYPATSLHRFSNSTQALTTLDLSSNSIGDEGARSLVDALKFNQVRPSTYGCLTPSRFAFLTDAHHTPPWRKHNRLCRIKKSGWFADRQQGEDVLLACSNGWLVFMCI